MFTCNNLWSSHLKKKKQDFCANRAAWFKSFSFNISPSKDHSNWQWQQQNRDGCLLLSASDKNLGKHITSIPKSDWLGYDYSQTYRGLDPQWSHKTNTTWRSGFALADGRHYARRLKNKHTGRERDIQLFSVGLVVENPHRSGLDRDKKAKKFREVGVLSYFDNLVPHVSASCVSNMPPDFTLRSIDFILVQKSRWNIVIKWGLFTILQLAVLLLLLETTQGSKPRLPPYTRTNFGQSDRRVSITSLHWLHRYDMIWSYQPLRCNDFVQKVNAIISKSSIIHISFEIVHQH